MPTPTSDNPLKRRTVLTAGGGVAVAAAVAACSSSPSAGSGTSTPSAGSGTNSSGTGSSGTGGGPLAAVADIPDGGSLVVDGVLLARTGDKVVGHSDVCTHKQCKVAAAGAQGKCPCHGSVYNASTGEVIQGPAPSPLPEVAVTVKNGSVYRA